MHNDRNKDILIRFEEQFMAKDNSFFSFRTYTCFNHQEHCGESSFNTEKCGVEGYACSLKHQSNTNKEAYSAVKHSFHCLSDDAERLKGSAPVSVASQRNAVPVAFVLTYSTKTSLLILNALRIACMRPVAKLSRGKHPELLLFRPNF